MAAPATVAWNRDLVQGLAIITLTFTADGDYSFSVPRPAAMSFHAQGGGGNNFGSGTASLQASNDNTNFFALPTTAVSTGSNAIKSVSVNDLGFAYYNVHLTGSTSPTLTVIIAAQQRR